MKGIKKVIFAAAIFGVALIIDRLFIEKNSIIIFSINVNKYVEIVLYLIPYLIVGFDIIREGFYGIRNGFVLDECVLMTLATVGAFIIGEYHEAVFVMLLYQLGEFFGDYATDKSEKNIEALLDIKSDVANLVKSDGSIEVVNPSTIEIGSEILVKNGERIPIDGVVSSGQTLLNQSALTGESIPKKVKLYDEVLSGMINTDAPIKIKTTKLYDDSTASKIIEMVNSATEKKSKAENFITSFAKVYTPIVCILALLVFLVPTFINFAIYHKDLFTNDYVKVSLYRALTLLVISCPCALVVSIPLAFFSSIGNASKNGILIKGTNYLDVLSKVKVVAFDKTGTMTKGIFEIVAVHNEKNYDKDELIEKAALVEYYSNHPIAKCIKKEYNKNVDISRIKDCKEIGGYGLSAYIDDKLVLVGSEKLMIENDIDFKECEHKGTIVHVAIEKKYLGHIVISDIIKKEAKESVEKLKNIGIKETIMLTGDKKVVGEEAAKEIGIDNVYTELLPQNKLSIIEKIITSLNSKKEKFAFVGDGINDAPVLVRSDVGISMGSIGSDSAVEASDVVIMDDNPIKVSKAILIAKKTMLVSYEIIFFSIFIKILFLILSSIGISNMWFAVFADVGVMILCVINAMRLMFAKYD